MPTHRGVVRRRAGEPGAGAVSCTLTLTARRWEFQFGLIAQLEYRPVLTRWRNADEHGFIFRLLCLVVRYGADNR